MSSAWFYPVILVVGPWEAWGLPMNGVLRTALTNPWLAGTASFLPTVAFLGVLFLCQPRPLPGVEGLGAMP